MRAALFARIIWIFILRINAPQVRVHVGRDC